MSVPSSSSSTYLPTVLLGCVPAFFMLICTAVGMGIRVPPNVAGALQHFAAGLLLSAIGTELLPELVAANGLWPNVGATIGFFLGMAVLIGLGMVLPSLPNDDDHDDHDDDNNKYHDGKHKDGRHGTQCNDDDIDREGVNVNDNDEDDHDANERTLSTSLRSLGRRRQSLRSQGYRYDKKYWEESNKTIASSTGMEERSIISMEDEGLPLLVAAENLSRLPERAFPTAFFLAVIVDSYLDGLLIGIATAAGPGAGPMMAASLSVEMAFLGLTLATALKGTTMGKAIGAACAGPVILVMGALCGALLSSTLQHEPALFAAMIGFGTSALLFMVAEELLLEAHEDGAAHVWWVDLQLYFGFYASFMSTKFLGEQ